MELCSLNPYCQHWALSAALSRFKRAFSVKINLKATISIYFFHVGISKLGYNVGFSM